MDRDLYRWLRPLLFRLGPEAAHERVLGGLAFVSRSRPVLAAIRRWAGPDDPRLAVELFGRHLPNPLGVAAGLDKNGVAVPALLALGFGFVEVGTVTPRQQPGNPRPRLFRLPEDQALINRLGFPGQGMEAVAARLARAGDLTRVGVNIGPNKEDVGEEAAIAACAAALNRLAELGPAYAVINVSSPNTARLRDLQDPAALRHLLAGMLAARSPAAASLPLLVKIAPDLADAELDPILQVVTDLGLAGIVATNTTVGRPPGLRGRFAAEAGGLSGKPLRPLADRIVARIHEQTGGHLPIIAAGGVFTGADVLAKIAAGATAVQLYTGFVYRGPATAKRIKRELLAFLDRHGLSSVADARGTRLPAGAI